MTFIHQQYIDHYNDWLTELNQNEDVRNHEEKEISDTLQSNLPQSTTTSVSSSSEPIPSTSANVFTSSGSGSIPFKKVGYDEVKVFENDQVILYVKKAFHQRQKRFRLEDSLFHIKVEVKNQIKKPLLRDLVKVLQEAFTFILNNIRTFFRTEDHNIAYLTLFQEPMVNGLNTGNILFLTFYFLILVR